MQQNATKLIHAQTTKTCPESMLRKAGRCNTINENEMECNNAQAVAMKHSEFLEKRIAKKNYDIFRNALM